MSSLQVVSGFQWKYSPLSTWRKCSDLGNQTLIKPLTLKSHVTLVQSLHVSERLLLICKMGTVMDFSALSWDLVEVVYETVLA